MAEDGHQAHERTAEEIRVSKRAKRKRKTAAKRERIRAEKKKRAAPKKAASDVNESIVTSPQTQGTEASFTAEKDIEVDDPQNHTSSVESGGRQNVDSNGLAKKVRSKLKRKRANDDKAPSGDKNSGDENNCSVVARDIIVPAKIAPQKASKKRKKAKAM